MSHPSLWRCKACGAPLGTDHGGELRVAVPDARLGRDGILRVACPNCGGVRSRKATPRPDAAGDPAYSL